MRSRRNEVVVALLIAVVCVVAIDAITNELDIFKYSWGGC